MFKLPAYEDLSKEQDTIYNLPLKGNYLVTGPPGTGKTVMAIYRAQAYTRAKMGTRFVVYNKTLDQYLDHTTTVTNVAAHTSTFHSWFASWYRNNFYHNAPQIERYVFDWVRIRDKLWKAKSYSKLDSLIIDEGQDFANDFYLVATLIADNITVFADDNQRITEDRNSTINEIRTFLQVDKIYTLTQNYRNSLEIARFSREFYADLSSGVPDLPTRKGNMPKLYTNCDFDTQAKLIATYAKNNRHHAIGVFVNTKNEQKKIQKALEKITDVPVYTYISGSQSNNSLEFERRGIKIVNYRSAKGLEFNAVFLPELQTLRTDANEDFQKMMFFVLTSRARDQLWMLTQEPDIPNCLARVPEDLYVLL